MTLDEAVALLREASVVCEYPEFVESSASRKHAREVRARIDAALAAHDAEPEAVEWTDNSSTGAIASCDDGTEMWISRWGDGVWHWWVEYEFARTGDAATKEEAKAAALKAARSAR